MGDIGTGERKTMEHPLEQMTPSAQGPCSTALRAQRPGSTAGTRGKVALELCNGWHRTECDFFLF